MASRFREYLRATVPLVTIVIATIPGRDELLKRALASADAQTAPHELVLVTARDDEGAAETRNRALEKVTTPWIAWLDDDDELLPDHVESLLMEAFIRDVDLVYPGMRIIGMNDPLAVQNDEGVWVNPYGMPFTKKSEEHLRVHGNFIPITYLVKTECVRLAGGFPIPFTEEWPRDCEDYGLILKMLDQGVKIAHLKKRTWIYHVHGKNTGGLVEKRQ